MSLYHVKQLRVRDQLQLDVGQKKHGIPREEGSGHITCRVKLIAFATGLEDTRQKQNVTLMINSMVI